MRVRYVYSFALPYVIFASCFSLSSYVVSSEVGPPFIVSSSRVLYSVEPFRLFSGHRICESGLMIIFHVCFYVLSSSCIPLSYYPLCSSLAADLVLLFRYLVFVLS
ncbi:hypothetical protein V8D89_009656 [Ganoderma adspersum]